MESYLRTDGILVVKMIRNNCGVNSTTEVVECLYSFFQKLEQKRRHVDDDNDAKKNDDDAAASAAVAAAVAAASGYSTPRLAQPQQQQQQRTPSLKMLPHSDQFYYSHDSQPPSIHGGGKFSPSASSGLRSRFHDHPASLGSIDKINQAESTPV